MNGAHQKIIEINIETLAGTTFSLKVSVAETVQSVKAKIQRLEGIPISHQHLVWQSRELDDADSLKDYNISDGSTLKMVLALRGGPINTRRLTTEETILRDVSDLIGIREDSNLWNSTPNAKEPAGMNNGAGGGGGVGGGAGNNDSSSSYSINKHITLLLFRNGDHLNLLKLVDRCDETSPASGAMSAASMYLPYEDTDIEQSPNVKKSAKAVPQDKGGYVKESNRFAKLKKIELRDLMLESPNRKLKVLNENEKTKQKMREIQKKLNSQKGGRGGGRPANSRKSSKSAKAEPGAAEESGAPEPDSAKTPSSMRKSSKGLESAKPRPAGLPTILKNPTASSSSKERPELAAASSDVAAADEVAAHPQKLASASTKEKGAYRCYKLSAENAIAYQDIDSLRRYFDHEYAPYEEAYERKMSRLSSKSAAAAATGGGVDSQLKAAAATAADDSDDETVYVEFENYNTGINDYFTNSDENDIEYYDDSDEYDNYMDEEMYVSDEEDEKSQQEKAPASELGYAGGGKATRQEMIRDLTRRMNKETFESTTGEKKLFISRLLESGQTALCPREAELFDDKEELVYLASYYNQIVKFVHETTAAASKATPKPRGSVSKAEGETESLAPEAEQADESEEFKSGEKLNSQATSYLKKNINKIISELNYLANLIFNTYHQLYIKTISKKTFDEYFAENHGLYSSVLDIFINLLYGCVIECQQAAKAKPADEPARSEPAASVAESKQEAPETEKRRDSIANSVVVESPEASRGSKKRVKVVNNWFFDFNLILFNLKQHRQMFLQIAHFIQSFRNNDSAVAAAGDKAEKAERASSSSRAGHVSAATITNDFKLVFRMLRKLQSAFSLADSASLATEAAAASQASCHADQYRKMSSSKSKSHRGYWPGEAASAGYKQEKGEPALLMREKFLEKMNEDLSDEAAKSTAEDAYSLYDLQSNARSPLVGAGAAGGPSKVDEFRDVLSDEIIIDHYKISFNTSSKKVTFLPSLSNGSGHHHHNHGSHSAGHSHQAATNPGAAAAAAAAAAALHESTQFVRKNRLIGDILNKSMIPPIILQRKQNDVSSYNKYSSKFHQKNINLLSSELVQKKPSGGLKPTTAFQETESQQPVPVPPKPGSSSSRFSGSRVFSSEKSLNTAVFESVHDSAKGNKLPPIHTASNGGETRDDLEVGKLEKQAKKKKDLTRYCFYCNKKTGLASSYSCRCGRNFCTQHRNAEAHNCTFDYKADGKKIIEHNNPLVAAPKLPKI